MRILLLTTSGELGGAEVSVSEMAASLVANGSGHELRLIAPNSGPLLEVMSEFGIEAQVIPYPRLIAKLGDSGTRSPGGGRLSERSVWLRGLLAFLSLLPYMIRLRLAIENYRPAIVHLHGFKSLLLGTWATPRSVPVVWHVHDYISPRPLMRRLLRLSVHRCAMTIANSKSTERDFRSACGKDLRTASIYYSIDLQKFHPEGKQLRIDQADQKHIVKVGLVATMAQWKGHSVFLRALAMLPDDVPIHAYVVGGPIYTTDGSQCEVDHLLELAESLGIQQRVTFTGYLRDVASVMRTMDIVVHASTEPEPFGLVIAEAMASGRPVIVSEAGGAAEILMLGGGGLGFPPRNAFALADRIYQLAIDRAWRESLGTQGRQVAEKHFARCRMGEDLVAIYESVLSASQARAEQRRKAKKNQTRVRDRASVEL